MSYRSRTLSLPGHKSVSRCKTGDISLQVVGAPGIKFVGGSSLQSFGNAEVKEVPKPAAPIPQAPAATAPMAAAAVGTANSNTADDTQDDCKPMIIDSRSHHAQSLAAL